MAEDDNLLYWQDFQPGQICSYEAAAKASPFGGIVANDWHTSAISQRLLVQQRLIRSACKGRLGVDELWLPKPVRPGGGRPDGLGTEPSGRRTDRGTVTSRCQLENQRGEVVLSMTSRIIFRRRELAGDPAAGSR